ncbi:MAG: hypothetical protein IJD11_00905, partial [Oscillospiraceae bacterium]|nr:hypothetical protein [Oscillospiraceae bacterium]
MMTDKENALRIINFDHPDHIMAGIPGYNIGYHGVNHQSFDDTGDDGHWRPVGVIWHDIWGTGWEKDQPDVMGFPRENPLSEPDKLADYVWPDPDDPRICNKIYEQAKDFRKLDYADQLLLCGSHRDTLWEKAYMLVGMENMMCYLYEEPEFAAEVLHKIMDFQMGIAKHYIEVGVEMVSMSDDMGTQHSLLFSPQIFNEFFLPEYRRIFDFYKSHGVLIGFHSCGHIEPLLETFIDLGVNVLNPVQATANDLKNVRKITKGRMAVLGGISSGLVMDGTPQ